MAATLAAVSVFSGLADTAYAQQRLSPTEIAARAAVTPPFSEERNAATGFIATRTFYIGRMALTCKALLGEEESFPADMVAKWRTANASYARATARYTNELLKSIPDSLGAQALASYINSTVRRDGQKAVDDVLKGTEEERRTACMKFVILFANGQYNVSDKEPFFATLQELVQGFDW
ncbi:hypothetical protein [Pandoraea sp. PE-S2R-1]|uniref:hypothetical protein n=1 Tax=Pandoraea sp. PE-S2R-1 TaxID=1986994 RepID=UPI001131DC0D|nr:hypothetical protein [Pandoraea sp. PE-S2R-1]